MIIEHLRVPSRTLDARTAALGVNESDHLALASDTAEI
jgi:hypothetical protein